MQNLIMRYNTPAEDSITGWEKESLPLGNGFFGASVFGIPQRERIQITENTFANPLNLGGVSNFLEIYAETGHENVTDYQRGLNLTEAVTYTRYRVGDSEYTRETFVSHPAKLLCSRMTAAKDDLSLRIYAEVPQNPADFYEGGIDRSWKLAAADGEIVVSGTLHAYELPFYAKIKVLTDGALSTDGDAVLVQNARRVDLFFSCDTGYELTPQIFLEDAPPKKLGDKNPAETVEALFAAADLDYERQRAAHLADYQNLFCRTQLSLSDAPCQATVPELLEALRAGTCSPYLMMLYFAFGRYLLIASSREDTLPANLQGIWSAHVRPPWSSGYWHNINVQMNYWPAFSTDLGECFEAYRRYNEAFRPKARLMATEFLKEQGLHRSEDDSANGWAIGTAATPYEISMPGSHSGPGTGALTSKLFWDYYDFTRDPALLKNCTLPALREMSVFLMNCVKEYDGRYLAEFSASPEQIINGYWRDYPQYHQTVGCAFDQQMLWENGRDLIAAADTLGVTDEIIEAQRQQLPHYDPVQIGLMGQIKEYEEETWYGDIGEYEHRHISHLVGLYPGTSISTDTPAWLDNARITLLKRSDYSTGWALAHRLNAWARVGDGDHAELLLHNLLAQRTYDNLWDVHPPFQIDGNFGATAGISEMLLQSHSSAIRILPALPKSWQEGSVTGLVTRGNFKLDITWAKGSAVSVSVLARAGGRAVLEYPGFANAAVTAADGRHIAHAQNSYRIAFETEPGQRYEITGISPVEASEDVEGLTLCTKTHTLSWKPEANVTYRVYRALEGSPDYVLLQETREASFLDATLPTEAAFALYKVTAQVAGKTESSGVLLTLFSMREVEQDRYLRRLWNLNYNGNPAADNTRVYALVQRARASLTTPGLWKTEIYGKDGLI